MKKLKKLSLIISSAIILTASCHSISAEPENTNTAKSISLFTNNFDFNLNNTINWDPFGNEAINLYLDAEHELKNTGYCVYVENVQNKNEGVITDIGHNIKPSIKYYGIRFYVLFEAPQNDITKSFSISVLKNSFSESENETEIKKTSTEIFRDSFEVEANKWKPISCSFSIDGLQQNSEDGDYSLALTLDNPDETVSSFYYDSVSLTDITSSMESINNRIKENENASAIEINDHSRVDTTKIEEEPGHPLALLIIIVITCLFLIFLVISVPLLMKKYSDNPEKPDKK